MCTRIHNTSGSTIKLNRKICWGINWQCISMKCIEYMHHNQHPFFLLGKTSLYMMFQINAFHYNVMNLHFWQKTKKFCKFYKPHTCMLSCTRTMLFTAFIIWETILSIWCMFSLMHLHTLIALHPNVGFLCQTG